MRYVILPRRLLLTAVVLTLAGMPALPQEQPSVSLPPGLILLEEALEGPYVLTGTLSAAPPAQAELEIVFNLDEQTGDHYLLSIKGTTAQFYKVSAGTLQPLGLSGKINWPAQGANFSLRREQWRLSFICDTQMVVRAYDSDLHGPRVGYAARRCQVSDCFIQHLGEMYMSDDFMRPAGEESNWEPISGTWAQQSLRTDPLAEKMRAELSANAFSYLGKSDQGRAMAVSGYWFWEGYICQAAMQAVAGGAMGLVGYYQDPENYLAVRWTSRLSEGADANKLQLIEVHMGREKLLAQAPGGFLPEQWYQVRLGLSAGLACVYIDDQLRLAARTDHFGQGRFGLLAEGKRGGFFDDVLVRPWQVLSEKFVQSVPGKWKVLWGEWSLGEDGTARVRSAAKAAAITGNEDWADYKYGADITAKSGGLGLIFGWTSSDDYYLFRWADPDAPVEYRGQAQIVGVTAGRSKVLDVEPLTRSVSGKERAKVTIQQGLITGWLGDQAQVQVIERGLPGGSIGLYAEHAASASFDNLHAEELLPPPTAHLVKEFTNIEEHREMAEWASRRGLWVTPPDPDKPEAQWQTKGDYFGDKVVELSIPQIGSVTGTMSITVDANPGQEQSGYTLTIAVQKDSNILQVGLLAGEHSLAEATWTADSDTCTVRFSHQGQIVMAVIDDKMIFKERVP